MEGLLQNADGISGEVTIQLKDGGTVTVNLQDVDVDALRQGVGAVSLGAGDPVTLELDDKKGVLADLVPLVGVGVEAKFNRSTNDLLKLEVEDGGGDEGDDGTAEEED